MSASDGAFAEPPGGPASGRVKPASSLNSRFADVPPVDGDGKSFETLDVTRVRRAIARLHEEVTRRRGRVEIRRRGCDDVCVMISKTELEALEQALEILSDSTEYRAMCDTVAQVAAATCDGYAPVQV